jgi:hypothetical protein
VVALELVQIIPGLAIADEARQTVLTKVGDIHILGDGNTLSFTPIFWTKGLAAPGPYSATFRLHDLRSEGTPIVSTVILPDLRSTYKAHWSSHLLLDPIRVPALHCTL